MNKRDVLVDVVKRVKSEGVIRFQYYNNGCYCAVGHLMNACGIDAVTFGIDTEFSGIPIASILGHKSLKVIKDLGFTLEELEALQRINDKSFFDSKNADLDRKESVLSLLETFIRRTEHLRGEIVNE